MLRKASLVDFVGAALSSELDLRELNSKLVLALLKLALMLSLLEKQTD